MHPNCEAVNHILEAAGLAGRVRMLGEAVTTARAAAQHLGCPVGAIAKLADLLHRWWRTAVDHDERCASRGHYQSR